MINTEADMIHDADTDVFKARCVDAWGDTIEVSLDCGWLIIECDSVDSGDHASVLLSKQDVERLRDYLIAHLERQS